MISKAGFESATTILIIITQSRGIEVFNNYVKASDVHVSLAQTKYV